MSVDVIHHGDCLDVLPTLDAESVDAVVTDPPYHLTSMTKRFGPGQASAVSVIGKRLTGGFMGKAWDGGDVAFRPETWAAVLRVMKPGAHLVAFGGTRTYHRLACAIEDAGFEIRDCLTWLYGSGFPKSLDVSKSIDKAAGAEREVTGVRSYGDGHIQRSSADKLAPPIGTFVRTQDDRIATAPATDDAKAWQGWGTALKPAAEMIVLARKPLGEKSVAANVLRHGTGAVNVDACRIDARGERFSEPGGKKVDSNTVYGLGLGLGQHPAGRWPANVLLDSEAATLLDEQSGERGSGSRSAGVRKGLGYHGANGDGGPAIQGDSGGASRFFYTAKADGVERNAGLGSRNTHPTVKPVDLMAWLVRLVTPPGGVVLDPFLGSGTTAIACVGNGCHYIGIEREAEYVAIAEQRIGLGCRVQRAAS